MFHQAARMFTFFLTIIVFVRFFAKVISFRVHQLARLCKSPFTNITFIRFPLVRVRLCLTKLPECLNLFIAFVRFYSRVSS